MIVDAHKRSQGLSGGISRMSRTDVAVDARRATGGRLLALAALLGLTTAAASLSGCSHVSYTRGVQTQEALGLERLPSPESNYGETTFDTHEIVLADRTGILGSALGTGLEGTSSAFEAKRKAEAAGKRSAEYSYRVHRPDEYDGAAIGVYYKWGSSQSPGQHTLDIESAINPDIDGRHTSPYSATLGEGGLHMGGKDTLIGDWLSWSILVRIGLTSYDLTPDPMLADRQITERQAGDAEAYGLRVPSHFGLIIDPEWLYGLAVHGWFGADMVGWLFTGDRGSWSDKLDYGGDVSWGMLFGDFGVSLLVGYAHQNHAWGEYWVRYDQFYGALALDVDLVSLFD